MALTPEVLNLLNQHVALVERPSDPPEETRSISIEQDSMGNITAESFKLYNIAQVSNHDLLTFVGKELGILLFDDTAKKIMYALLMLLFDFAPKLKLKFNEQDAKVLFAVAKLGKKAFTTSALQSTFSLVHASELTPEKLEASLEALVQYKVLKRTAFQEYELRRKKNNEI
ncbi:MAG: hypothetical protein HC892_23530 [Saprospiraceae bacterium]|nr:hypothetical protein [Saprospiraceae bacterium]